MIEHILTRAENVECQKLAETMPFDIVTVEKVFRIVESINIAREVLEIARASNRSPVDLAREVSAKKPMTVAILQVQSGNDWLIIGVYATKEAAELAASLARYTRWSVSEFGVIGWKNA